MHILSRHFSVAEVTRRVHVGVQEVGQESVAADKVQHIQRGEKPSEK